MCKLAAEENDWEMQNEIVTCKVCWPLSASPTRKKRPCPLYDVATSRYFAFRDSTLSGEVNEHHYLNFQNVTAHQNQKIIEETVKTIKNDVKNFYRVARLTKNLSVYGWLLGSLSKTVTSRMLDSLTNFSIWFIAIAVTFKG